MAGARPRLLRSPTGWALIAACAAEFALFDQVAARHHSWIFPRWNDQVQYLTECYTGWEYLKAHGFWAGLWQTLVNASAQGTLHDFAGMLAFTVAGGPSRSALLALNMLALIAWQAAGFIAVARGTGSRSLAWTAAALPLLLAWPWNGWAGSMADFRLDHFAMCALGVTFACAQLTDGFRSGPWSLGFGAAVGLTLITRFLTGTYFTLIFIGLGVWSLGTPDRVRRLRHLALAALVAFTLAAPVFWLNRDWVWNYYWIGHFTGPESAIRSPHMNFERSVAFVWGNFQGRHLGPAFWRAVTLASGMWGAFAAAGWFSRRRKTCPTASAPDGATSSARSAPALPQAPFQLKDWAATSAIFALSPAIVLTLHSQKSEIVLGVIAPGFIGLIVTAWWAARHLTERQLPAALRWIAVLPALLVCVLAALHFQRAIQAPAHDAEHTADMRTINRIADRIFESLTAAKLARPWVGVNEVSSGLDALVLSVICYERHRIWVPFAMTLPTGIAEADEKLVMERVALSDFFFLVEAGYLSDWPFDRQQRALAPKVRAWCEAHRRAVETYDIFGQRMVLYQRREIPFDPKSL